MSKRFKAAVIGGSGYGGAELIRRLLAHPEVELVRVASIDYVGQPLSAVHPNLEGQTALTFEGLDAADAARGMDVVLLGLPHKVSAGKARRAVLGRRRAHRGHSRATFACVTPPRTASTTARSTRARKSSRGVRSSTGFPSSIARPFGARDTSHRPVASRRRSSSPFFPSRRARLLCGPVEVVSITGSSLAAASRRALRTHHPVRANNLKTYKPLTSTQHAPEDRCGRSDDARATDFVLRFVPVSAPLSRGIFATCFAHVDAAVDPSAIAALYAEAYAAEPFVRVPAKRLPEVVAVKGSNYAEVGVQPGDVDAGKRVVACFAATDNLIKGGAGQAIQSMNLMLGLDERLTLQDPGGWP